MTPEEFFKAMMPYARRVSERTGLDPRLVLAQSALETGYGKSAPNSNYFGIKGAGQVFPSEEFFDGKMVVEPSEFRAYENPQQSFDDYASFITGNKRYEPVLKAKTLSDQIAAMGASGYATDPNYGAKLSSIANMIGEDILPKGTSMATPMDRAREEELRMQMLASGTAPQAAPRAPLSALRQDRPQAAAAPQQRTGGLGGIMDYLGKQSPTTGLSRAEQFAAALDPLIMPEMRAGEAIRARGTQRQAEARKNKTMEYLATQAATDPLAAQMLEMARATGDVGGAVSALMQQRLKGPKDTFKDVQALRKEFTGLSRIKNFSDVTEAYTRIIKSAKDPSAAGDLALIFNYMKVLDPASVVRESEFAAAAKAGGLGPRIQAAVEQIERGTRLAPEQRADFVNRATQLYQGAEEQARPIYQTYEEIATARGFDPKKALPEFGYKGELYQSPPEFIPAPTPPVPAGATANGQPLTQTQWESIWRSKTEEERKKWQDTGSFN